MLGFAWLGIVLVGAAVGAVVCGVVCWLCAGKSPGCYDRGEALRTAVEFHALMGKGDAFDASEVSADRVVETAQVFAAYLHDGATVRQLGRRLRPR